jgi:hypothetical protein
MISLNGRKNSWKLTKHAASEDEFMAKFSPLGLVMRVTKEIF